MVSAGVFANGAIEELGNLAALQRFPFRRSIAE
jgi:hypothetical protein